jgi:hypothetical protein
MDGIGGDRSAVGRNKRSALRRAVSTALPEVALFRDVAGPIFRKKFRLYVAVERRMRPIADTRDQTVLDRIDVTIFDVAAKILLIADQMFPEPTLPDGAFTSRNADVAPRLGRGNGLGEGDLNQPPAQRKIGVAGRQCPNCVDVIRQDHHGVDRKRMARLRDARRVAQRVDMVRQKAALPVQQVDGEEPASAGHEGTAIIWHGGDDSRR